MIDFDVYTFLFLVGLCIIVLGAVVGSLPVFIVGGGLMVFGVVFVFIDRLTP